MLSIGSSRLYSFFILLAALGGLFLVFGGSAAAQTFDNSIETRDIKIVLDPPTPGTNETVTVSVESLIVNVNRMRITWFVDGVVVGSGVGETEITITTKGQGELSRVEAYVQVDGETNLRKWIQIAPADLDMLWQADTHTPPFYRGKALPTPESFITIIGLPNLRNEGAETQENSVIFNWSQNGKNLPEDSGYGANPLVIRNDFLSSEERIELTAIHTDGVSRSNQTVTIAIEQPIINIYEESSYLRNANRIESRASGQEFTFIAEPFFYSVSRDLKKILRFTWFTNGQVVDSALLNNKPYILPTRSIGDGVADIGIRIEHPLKPLQLAPQAAIRVIQ